MKRTTSEEVLHEYPAIGKYRVRIVATAKAGGDMATVLDVREIDLPHGGLKPWGVQLSTVEDLKALRAVLNDAIKRERLAGS